MVHGPKISLYVPRPCKRVFNYFVVRSTRVFIYLYLVTMAGGQQSRDVSGVVALAGGHQHRVQPMSPTPTYDVFHNLNYNSLSNVMFRTDKFNLIKPVRAMLQFWRYHHK